MFLKVGHRGARAYETENTLASFQKAVELGANAVELDVRATADSVPIVFHDEDLKRVFGSDTVIARSSFSAIQQAGNSKIPSLQEALAFIGSKVQKIIIELKETGLEQQVLDVVNSLKMQKKVIIASFHEEAISTVRGLNSAIETGLIYAKHRNPVAAALELKAQYLIALYKLVHTKNIETAHKHGLKIIVWTINTKEEADAFRAKGVDGIASDMPDIL
ncbi:MAG: glycerophosphodiester phosphodiesterase [Dissulfurispiraceae bacterium]|jgi:glycerophosphoryl diester phosphodiesterase|nr:glycerophosphodiester phosphodiesterase [Dissulfurispiraceae bacterium]